MGFFKDLFSAPRPCDVCQLGKGAWSSARSAVAHWDLRGQGLNVHLLVCSACYRAVTEAGVREKNPVFALAILVQAGHADRPPAHAYLQHPEWRKIWMHTLEGLGIEVSDEFSALAAIKQLDDRLFEQLANAGEDESA